MIKHTSARITKETAALMDSYGKTMKKKGKYVEWIYPSDDTVISVAIGKAKIYDQLTK